MALADEIDYDINAFSIGDLLDLLREIMRLVINGMGCTVRSSRKIENEVQFILSRSSRNDSLPAGDKKFLSYSQKNPDDIAAYAP